jgi:hypothetical protein
VSERGGGLKFVEAMALSHQDGAVEVACNLLNPEVTSPEAVQLFLEQAVSESFPAGLSGGDKSSYSVKNICFASDEDASSLHAHTPNAKQLSLRGIQVQKGYSTGKTVAELVNLTLCSKYGILDPIS